MKTFFFGFTAWKTFLIDITPFFDEKVNFINPIFGQKHLEKGLRKGLDINSAIYIWGKKSVQGIEHYAYTYKLPIYRVEDGFIRSFGLGSDLTQPYSLVVDSRGIYFDPTQSSDLEHILQNHIFTETQIIRAQYIRHYLVDKKLSKYNVYANVELDLPKGRTIVVVPGQVEDDASIRFGANGMTNLELLKQTRINCPDAYIIYKPHPDVLSGNRVGDVDESEALKYCDRIVSEVGIDSVLVHANEVHTMTSLVGFEALIRGIKVVTYGLPFYAGWGLSDDSHTCERRSRKLSIDELVAGAYLLYPRYIHPHTKQRCEIEALLSYLDEERFAYSHSLWIKLRNGISRKLQMLIRMIKGIA